VLWSTDHVYEAFTSRPCTPSKPPITSPPTTSISNSSIQCKTTPRLSKKPFTATLSMRSVVAAYSTTNVFSSEPSGASVSRVNANERVTSAESSLSTARARCAERARCALGNGMRIVLCFVSGAFRFHLGVLGQGH